MLSHVDFVVCVLRAFHQHRTTEDRHLELSEELEILFDRRFRTHLKKSQNLLVHSTQCTRPKQVNLQQNFPFGLSTAQSRQARTFGRMDEEAYVLRSRLQLDRAMAMDESLNDWLARLTVRDRPPWLLSRPASRFVLA